MQLTRSRFLTAAAASLSASLLASARTPVAAAATPFAADPFALGVASGDPLPSSVVLWTRLAGANPLTDTLTDPAYALRWELADDENFARVVTSGEAKATSALGYSVHVEVAGLQPARSYFYRFTSGDARSPVGRTRTAPQPGSAPAKLKFAFASCQHYEYGYYTAYKRMIEDDPDLIVFLGDYIYEYDLRGNAARKHFGDPGPQVATLAAYRQRYTQYRLDDDLREAHRVVPWIVTPDDHEVQNNWAGDIPEDDTPIVTFVKRRAAAYQAYYEFMPLRIASMPTGSHMQLYRAVDWGALARFTVLDTRQYRTDQPCGDNFKADCPDRAAPGATMMGADQEQWFANTLDASPARWNVLANQVMVATLRMPQSDGTIDYNMDQWDGYPAARDRLAAYLARRKPNNPVIVTGDFHKTWVGDIRQRAQDERSPIVASEIVGTSITSGGDGNDKRSVEMSGLLASNPHLHFYDPRRGYVNVVLDAKAFRADIRVLERVSVANAPVATAASFAIEDGRLGIARA